MTQDKPKPGDIIYTAHKMYEVTAINNSGLITKAKSITGKAVNFMTRYLERKDETSWESLDT